MLVGNTTIRSAFNSEIAKWLQELDGAEAGIVAAELHANGEAAAHFGHVADAMRVAAPFATRHDLRTRGTSAVADSVHVPRGSTGRSPRSPDVSGPRGSRRTLMV